MNLNLYLLIDIMLIKKERTAEKNSCNFILNIFKYMVCTGKQKNI